MEVGKNKSEHLVMHLSNIKEVLAAASMGIWCMTLRDGCKPRLKASDEMLGLLGMDKEAKLTEEDVFEGWYSRICPQDMDAAQEYLRKVVAGIRSEITYRWEHPTQGTRYVRCGGIGHMEPDGTQIVEGYHYDITEQETLHRQDVMVVNALANIYVCVFYVDLENDSYTASVNNLPGLTKYIPRTGVFSDSVKEMAEHLIKAADRKAFCDFVDTSTLNERLHYRRDISINVQGVFIGWLRFRLLVSDRKADGTVRSIVVTLTDITEEKEKEAEMIDELKVNVDANRSKTMMLQNMTHEIRTPLNAMFGFSQLLCMPDGCVSDEQKSEYFNYIYNSFNMLSMLIDDVLDISDAEHGNYRIEKRPFEVNKVCQNAIQMAEIRLPAGVNMHFTSDVADDYTINSDGRRIQQVLVNFLTNACKHTSKGEIHLNLSTTENPGRLTFSVTDTGEGIPAEQAKDIFERYKKANNCVQGSGLGLHICSIIAEKLGAKVMLDQNYTTGARFLFIV